MSDESRFSPLSAHQKAYVCTHVFDGESPVLYVTRPDGDWCFLCDLVHPDDPAAIRVVGLHHLLDRDQSLHEVLDLGPNEEAERDDVGSPWTRSSFDAEQTC